MDQTYAIVTDLSSNRDEVFQISESTESNTSSKQDNLELIEIYTQKLLNLQLSLDQNFPDLPADTQNEIKPAKLKFKNLFEFKKDVVIRKLLKTIDLMNQELNKRDRLLIDREKRCQILENNQEKCLQQENEGTYYEFELNRAKQEILNEKNEKEVLIKKLKFLENQIAEGNNDKSDEGTVSDYKEIATPFSKNSADELHPDQNFIQELKKENQEMTFINEMLSTELNKLTRQIELLERKNVLESEINEKFQNLLQQKSYLEEENQQLLKRLDHLETKFKDCEKMVEEEITNSSKSYQEELQEAKKRLNDLENLSKQRDEIIDQYETEIRNANLINEKYNEERLTLIKTLNTVREEKAVLIQQSTKQIVSYEARLETSTLENEVLQEKCNNLSTLSYEQQKQMQKMFQELDEKKELTEKHAVKKSDEIKRLKQLLNLANEKIKYLQQKHLSIMESTRKKFNKDNEQLKFTNENNTIRNGELSRSNLEMRKKIHQLEIDLKDSNEKCFINKQNADLNLKQKKELKEQSEKVINSLKNETQSLELIRDEYLKKYLQQQELVDNMLKQLTSFQVELDSLVTRNTQLDDKVKKANNLSESYKNKYYELKDFLKKELNKIKFNEEKENKQKQQEKIVSQSERLYEANKRIINLIKELKIDDIIIDKDQKNCFVYSSQTSSSTLTTDLNDN